MLAPGKIGQESLGAASWQRRKNCQKFNYEESDGLDLAQTGDRSTRKKIRKNRQLDRASATVAEITPI
ncbi:hypothetical protein AB4Z32_12235 [Massilia sp. 2TAF26]|uniref:hypothetical protein n=1 Tax=Massilia sp. 2TAF26 TaxID=3233012 RepID=UPI003F992799